MLIFLVDIALISQAINGRKRRTAAGPDRTGKAHMEAVFGIGISHPIRVSDIWPDRHCDGAMVPAVSNLGDLLRRLGWLLSHPLESAFMGEP